MKTSVCADGDVRVFDVFFVAPSEIVISDDLCVASEPTDEILEMAVSLHTHGQRRPVECHKEEDGRLSLVHGFIRTAAARLIRSGFRCIDPDTKTEIVVRDRRFKLWVVITNLPETKQVHIHPERPAAVDEATAATSHDDVVVATQIRHFLLTGEAVGDVVEAWRACPREDWLLSLALRLGVEHGIVVRASCSCARLALSFTKDERPLRVVLAAERWVSGDRSVTPQVMAALVAACKHIGLDNGVHAAFAASAATYTAMYTAYASALEGGDTSAAAAAAQSVVDGVADAAFVAAYEDGALVTLRRICADTVRKYITEPSIASLWQEQSHRREAPAQNVDSCSRKGTDALLLEG
jgi:hypothetical protein